MTCDFFFLGGVKMRYPSCYVLVTDLDDSTAELYKNHSANQTNPQQQQQPQQHQHQQQQQQCTYLLCLFLTILIILTCFSYLKQYLNNNY